MAFSGSIKEIFQQIAQLCEADDGLFSDIVKCVGPVKIGFVLNGPSIPVPGESRWVLNVNSPARFFQSKDISVNCELIATEANLLEMFQTGNPQPLYHQGRLIVKGSLDSALMVGFVMNALSKSLNSKLNSKTGLSGTGSSEGEISKIGDKEVSGRFIQ